MLLYFWLNENINVWHACRNKRTRILEDIPGTSEHLFTRKILLREL